MGETHEIPHHNLADFEPWLGYATEGQAVGGIPLQNPLECPQHHPQLHLLHSITSKNSRAMAEMGKLDHLKERLRAIEGSEDYAFANLEELFLVPNIITPHAGLWQVQGDYLPQEPSKDVLSEDGGIRKRWGIADTFLPRKSYWDGCYLVH